MSTHHPGHPTRWSRRSTIVGATLALGMLLGGCGGSSGSSGSSGSASGGSNPYKLIQAGTLRTGTLTDAPPNVYLKDGKFTGFDNDLLNAVAAKIGLKVEFVGT